MRQNAVMVMEISARIWRTASFSNQANPTNMNKYGVRYMEISGTLAVQGLQFDLTLVVKGYYSTISTRIAQGPFSQTFREQPNNCRFIT